MYVFKLVYLIEEIRQIFFNLMSRNQCTVHRQTYFTIFTSTAQTSTVVCISLAKLMSTLSVQSGYVIKVSIYIQRFYVKFTEHFSKENKRKTALLPVLNGLVFFYTILKSLFIKVQVTKQFLLNRRFYEQLLQLLLKC